ncbi:thioredoxin fold domain-containing protein [Pseudosulfitobacter pseudonitzschiae]|uniref:thioredoxin fold domain-containing protein n=1 Tax=Pseudosulfitobacter pseudonitzschiae TaxID=1402135 RepID=UPI003B7C4996
MVKNMKSLMIALAGFMAAGPALAQTTQLPDFLAGREGIEYQGNVSGMDLYTMDDFTGLWLIAPDGRTAIAGSIFSATGRDIGSAFSGSDPVTAFQSETPLPRAEVSSSAGALVPEDTSDMMTPEEISQMAAGLEKIETEVFGDSMDLPETPTMLEQDNTSSPGLAADDVPIDPIQVTRNAENALEGFDEDEKEVLMRALVELLRDVKTEDEFKQAVFLWTNEIARRAQANEAGEKVTTDIVSDVQEEMNILTPVQLTTGQNDTPDDLADRFMKDIRYESLWFGIGTPTAPAVYAFIDPTCPYCARAMDVLKDEVEQGRLNLRIILSPALSDESLRYIAGILTAEDPPKAYWDHEISKARTGRSTLELSDWAALPLEIRTAVMGNMDLIKKYEITGVPFFGFETRDGVKVVSGVPQVADFDGALPDGFTGNQ